MARESVKSVCRRCLVFLLETQLFIFSLRHKLVTINTSIGNTPTDMTHAHKHDYGHLCHLSHVLCTGCPNKKETRINMPITLELDKHLNILGHYLLEGYLLFPTVPRNVGSVINTSTLVKTA